MTILVADDHPHFRQYMDSMLSEMNADIRILKAGNGYDCIELIKENHVDLVLLDILMPVMDGRNCLQIIKRDWPSLRVLMITQLESEDLVTDCMSMGAHGYLSKAAEVDDIKAYLKTQLEGNDVQQPLLKGDEMQLEDASKYDLTPREIEMMKLYAKDLNSAEVAKLMSISMETIKDYRKNVIHKMGVSHFHTALSMFNNFGKLKMP